MTRRLARPIAWFALLALIATTGACSMRRFAANAVGNALAKGPDVYSSDDDPDLVRDAVPFGLKTMESLLAVVPDNRNLLLAACRGFTQYAYAFVQSRICHLFPYFGICAAWQKHGDWWQWKAGRETDGYRWTKAPNKRRNGTSYSSVGIAVPISELRKAIGDALTITWNEG